MDKIRVITDSNSGILQSEAKKLGIVVIPMPFVVDGEEYLEEISLSQEEFYEKLKNDANVTTSQPSQIYLEELWDNELKKYDKLIYIPMSSGLSATCHNASNYAKKYDGKVLVVDNNRISVNQKETVFQALDLIKEGRSAEEIKSYLENEKEKVSIYITMGVLKYLKKGGRISATAAALGAMLNVKPILYSNGGAFEKFAMVLSLAQARKKMLAQAIKDLETKFKEDYEAGNMMVSIAHTQNEKEAERFKTEILTAMPKVKFGYINPLSLSVACHIGPGALAISLCKTGIK